MKILSIVKLKKLDTTKNFIVYTPLPGEPAVGKIYLKPEVFAGEKVPETLDFPISVPS